VRANFANREPHTALDIVRRFLDGGAAWI